MNSTFVKDFYAFFIQKNLVQHFTFKLIIKMSSVNSSKDRTKSVFLNCGHLINLNSYKFLFKIRFFVVKKPKT